MIPVPLVPRGLRWCGVGLVVTVIFYYSILAVPPETAAPDGIALPTWRHLLAYVALGLSIAYALADRPFSSRKKAHLVFALATGYGALIELGQAFVSGRHAALEDVLINAIAVAASLVWYVIEPRVEFVRISSTYASDEP